MGLLTQVYFFLLFSYSMTLGLSVDTIPLMGYLLMFGDIF